MKMLISYLKDRIANEKERSEELSAILVLAEVADTACEKMDNFILEDNYERKVILPSFPGEYTSKEERAIFQDEFDHEAEDAVERMRTLYADRYSPKKPDEPQIDEPQIDEPQIGEFKAPAITSTEKDTEAKLRYLGWVGAGIAAFFALGFVVNLFNRDYHSTLPVIFFISIIGAVLFVFSKYQTNKLQLRQKEEADKALAEYNQKKNEALTEYNQRKDRALAEYNQRKEDALAAYRASMEDYEEAESSYKSKSQTFLEEYISWREIYLHKVSEETHIAKKLKEDRSTVLKRIQDEILAPIYYQLKMLFDNGGEDKQLSALLGVAIVSLYSYVFDYDYDKGNKY